MKLVIQLVTWNSAKYLPLCMNSIFNQTFRDFQVVVIDNNSLDDSVKYLKQNFPQVTVFQNKQNNLFAKAHNQGLKLLNSDYVLVTNPDIVLAPDFLEKILNCADSHGEYGALAGKLLKMSWQDRELGIAQKEKTIDSVGLKINRRRQAYEKGMAEPDQGQFEKKCDIFGATGALALYRKEALQDIKMILPDGTVEYFDQDFGIYKEDVDLAWRLQKAGWPALYCPTAVAYHFRTAKKNQQEDWKKFWQIGQIFKERKSRNIIIRQNSYKNHCLLLWKHESLGSLMPDFFPIFFYELQKFFYLLFFEISTLGGLKAFYRKLPKIIRKRKLIKTKITAKELRAKWFK